MMKNIAQHLANVTTDEKQCGRRKIMRGLAALAVGSAAPVLSPQLVANPANSASKDRHADPDCTTNREILIASYSKPIVETEAGKVRGYIQNGIYTFKGVPYGAPTGGSARFMPPQKPRPWTGVRSSLHYGHVCPNGFGMVTGGDNISHTDEDAFLLYRAYGQPAGEDCLRVNVWTPEINSSRKRPVMVWMHGGGYSGGSGHDLLSYDGENLCHRGDVVTVTHNHRLNTFGYLNLAEIGGERYASSANVGMLDLVAVLEWVRDNISNFGGDPSNVTIFGQSGGGAKVCTLLATPQAKGLFHKAIIQSGSTPRNSLPEDSSKLAAAVLAELNLSKSQVDELQRLPVERLCGAAQAAAKKMGPPSGPPPPIRTPHRRIAWGPTVDGKILPGHPFDPVSPALSATVPILVGTNTNEFVNGVDNPEAETLTNDELEKRVDAMYGAKTADILRAYRYEYPAAKPFDIFSVISIAYFRQNAFLQAERKAALHAAPAYEYLFAWRTPMLDGRPGAFHSCEIAFVFDNASRCIHYTGASPEALRLSARVSQAWINFARYGNPNHSDLPKWPAFQEAKETMIFDNTCVVKTDPEGEGRRLLASA
jgi:para-nitrobenzyl esterase